MTREEQRNNAAIEYANAVTGGNQDAWFDVVFKTHQDATAWADEHPRKGLVSINRVCEFLRTYDKAAFPYRLIEDLRKSME